MEIRPLRQFKSHELRKLFDQEREVWQHQLYWDYSEPQRVISAMVDAGTLPGFVAMQDGDPVAYTFYVEISGKGLLGGCFASEWAAPEGVEHQLLEASIAVLKRNAALQRVESQFINFREWPIARFFAGKGFSQFDRCFMVRDCQIDHVHRRLVTAEVKQLSLGDLDDMAKLTVDTYASVIDRRVTYHYQSLAECLEFLSNLVYRPGCGTFLPEGSYSARDPRTSDLMGYVLTSRISPQDGHIPQIAVAPAHQGKGLGAELLGRAVRYLGLNGYQRVSLTVTELNLAALVLYQRFGFSIHFRFPAFVWEREGQPGKSPSESTTVAKWLISKKVCLVAHDHWAGEAVPGEDKDRPFECHQWLITMNGIHIHENVDMEELSANKVYEFAYVFSPIRLKGATGSPGNPIAVV